MTKPGLLPALTVVALLPVPVAAQWSSTPSSNLAIADGSAAQVQPKIAPTADGGCYISWFDSDPNGTPAYGYDVRLQRLDAAGRELWAHGGVLIADRGFSSTQDYGLAVDSTGNALLAFRDDRFSNVQVSAARVAPTGALLWGVNGVQLTNTSNFVAAPRITGTSDGKVVVAWTEGSDARVRKLDSNGVALWGADVVLTPTAGSFSPSDLHAADNGAAIVALQNNTGGFSSPRHLYAQKLDSNGGLLWGANHLAVFNGGSLQFGNFPKFIPDGAGGAVFAWYSSSPALECRAQRVLSAGTEAFPHNGSVVSTDATRLRTAPAVAFDPITQETFLAYRELNSGQSQVGVSAQKFDSIGIRQWTNTGQTIIPLSSVDLGNVTAVLVGSGVMAFWTAGPTAGQVQVSGARLDNTGATVVAPFVVSSTPATKSRLQAALSSLGYAITAWRDEGSGNADVLAQNTLPGGGLGGLASAVSRNGTGINPTCYSTSSDPVIGTTWTAQVAHSATNTATVLLADFLPAAGPILPGIGEVLVGLPALYANSVNSTGSADSHSLLIPAEVGLVGASLATQAVRLDGGQVGLCNAIDIIIGL